MLQQIHTFVGVVSSHQESLAEGFETVEQTQHTYQSQGGQQVGQCDVKKLLPGIGTVHGSSFIQVSGNPVQSCQPKDHVITGIFPDVGEHQYPKGSLRAHKIHCVPSQRANQPIHQTIFGKQYLPKNHNACHGDRHGKEETGAEHFAAPGIPAIPLPGHRLHAQGQKQAAQQEDRHTGAEKPYRIAGCQLKGCVFQHRLIIGKPHKPFSQCIAKAAADRFCKGDQHKGCGPQKAGQQEQNSGRAI